MFGGGKNISIMNFFSEDLTVFIHGKCSKFPNLSCLPKRSRQTEQTQIRLLVQKQSDQGCPCLLF